MNTLQEKKKSLKKEMGRISKMLNQKHQANFSLAWNRKRKHNTVKIKDIAQLKENGICMLVGIVYFTIAGEKTLLMGQTMLLIDRNGKEISCTSFFIKRKRVIELSYSWVDGMRLLGSSITECVRDTNKFIVERI